MVASACATQACTLDAVAVVAVAEQRQAAAEAGLVRPSFADNSL